MRTNKNHLVKYSNIALVRGYNRGIIYDFFRNDYHFVPNSMIDFIELYNGKFLNEEIKSYFKSYTDFLIDREIIFFCEPTEVECFIDMSTEWDYFSIISNAIIEVDDESNAHFEKTISYLCKLGCEDLLIFSKTPLSSVRIHNLFESMKDKLINSINIYFPDNNDADGCLDILKKYANIHNVLLFNSKENKMIRQEGQWMGNLIQSKKI